MTCRVCGCSEDNACVDESGVSCMWAEPGLCTFCVTGTEDFDVEEQVFVCPHCHAHTTFAEHSLYVISGRTEELNVWFDCRQCGAKVTPAELEELETVEA